MPATTTFNDAELRVVRLLLHRLFVDHVDAVYNVAYRVTWDRGDAEDVVQSTFLKGALRHAQLDDGNRERPWILQVAYREAIAVLRRRREVPTDPDVMPERVCIELAPDEALVSAELARVIGQALAGMDSTERLAVVLRDVEGLSMRELAEVMALGLSAAKMRVHRGRDSLRRLLESEGVVGAV